MYIGNQYRKGFATNKAGLTVWADKGRRNWMLSWSLLVFAWTRIYDDGSVAMRSYSLFKKNRTRFSNHIA